MLRQLFISIIILSALTSESIISLSGYFIASFFDVKGAQLMQEENSPVPDEKESGDLYAFSAPSSELFVLSSRSIHILKSKQNEKNLANDDAGRGYFPVVFTLALFVFVLCIFKLSVVFQLRKGHNISTVHSGLSPPVPEMA